jgi:Ornithine cyclodeaminase/mu-crystallin family
VIETLLLDPQTVSCLARPRDPTAARCSFETRLAFEPPPAGCFELEGLDPALGTELGEMLAGDRRDRSSDREITASKAMGHAVEDIVAAELVLEAAVREGNGRLLRL